jgi:hypothetical protein
MKRLIHLFAAKRIIRIIVVSIALSTALVVGSVATHSEQAHACGQYIISSSTTTVATGSGVVTFSLWFNSCNNQNFTSANVWSGSINGYDVTVFRNSGPDGGATSASTYNCPSTGICNSPGVYSPNNSAYASIYLYSNIRINSSAF